MPIQSLLSCYNKNDGQAVALTVFLHSPSTLQANLFRPPVLLLTPPRFGALNHESESTESQPVHPPETVSA